MVEGCMYTSAQWTEFVAFAKSVGASSSRTDVHGPVDAVFLDGRHVVWDLSERKVYGVVLDENAMDVDRAWLPDDPKAWFRWLFPEGT